MRRDSPPVIAFAGASGSGKTTFLSRLIMELKGRGLAVAAIKHHRRSGVQLDVPGKDTWRLFQAGADAVVFAAPDRVGLFRRLPRELNLSELLEHIPSSVDIVLAEGFKKSPVSLPTIEIVRSEIGQQSIADSSCLIGLVSDIKLPLDVPHFALTDVSGVASLLVERYFPNSSRMDTQQQKER